MALGRAHTTGEAHSARWGPGDREVNHDVGYRGPGQPRGGDARRDRKKVSSGVVMLSAEDGLSRHDCPRLAAADADLSRIIAVTECPEQDGKSMHPPVLPDDLDTVRRAIA